MGKCLGKPGYIIAREYAVSPQLVRKFAHENDLPYIGTADDVFAYVFDDEAEELFKNRNTARGRQPYKIEEGVKSAAKLSEETGFSRELVTKFAQRNNIPKSNGVYLFDSAAEEAFINREKKAPGRPKIRKGKEVSKSPMGRPRKHPKEAMDVVPKRPRGRPRKS